ncbi:MAG TPA: hypothetical protein VKT73_13260 [Xanthobacteraceae bacterium]|nr:hypothetical protein [Xanthobacteraceae bacterium]
MAAPSDPNITALSAIAVALIGGSGLSGVIVAIIGYFKSKSAYAQAKTNSTTAALASIGSQLGDRMSIERFLRLFQDLIDEIREIRMMMELSGNGRTLRKKIGKKR